MFWAALLLVLAFVLPAVAAVGLVAMLGRAVRRRRLLPGEPAKARVELAVAAAAIGLIVYGIGCWQGHLVDPRSASEICGGQVARALEQSPLPLRNRCQLLDGRSFDLVPAWINPVVGITLAGMLVCGVLSITARARRGHCASSTARRSQA